MAQLDFVVIDARFEQIRFVNERLIEAQWTFELMRLSVRKARAMLAAAGCEDGGRLPAFPMLIQAVVAPAGSGKTANALWYISGVYAREPRNDRNWSVVYLELSEATRPKDLWIGILRALDHPSPATGTEAQLREQAYRLLRLRGVEVLFIDEAHLIRHREDGTLKLSVLDALKRLANAGLCAIVLMGVERMMPFLTDPLAKEFKARCRPPVLLTPLDWTVDAEREMFLAHLAKLDVALQEAGLTTGTSGLHAQHAELLYDGSYYEWSDYHGAIIGDASKVVRFGLARMIRRGGLGRRARRILTADDLGHVVRNHVTVLKLGNESALARRFPKRTR
jgi:type II secretory pathway predicted ATPase ExeA